MARYLTCSRRQREEREAREREAREHRPSHSRGKDMARIKKVHRPRKRRSDSASNSNVTQSDNYGGGRRRNAASQPHPGFGQRMQMVREEDEKDRFYVIEELLDKRYDSNNNEEYLVRWQNYPPQYDSWEPRAELEKNSLDMINEFNRIQSPDSVEPGDVYCICKRPYRFDQGGMIQCNTCQDWFHFACIQMNMVEANSYAMYHCQSCRKVNPSLRNIVKRDRINWLYGNTSKVNIEKEVGPDEEVAI